MTQLSNREVCGALERKGFRKSDRGHHNYYLYVDGQKTAVFTFVSHGQRKSYGDSLLDFMARELHLTNKELRKLLECTITKPQYVQLLVQRGHLTSDYLVAVSRETR